MAKIGKSSVRIYPRTYKAGDMVEVKSRIIHPQHNGRFKNDEGEYIPLYFITEISAFYEKEKIFKVIASPGLSINPFFNFSMEIVKSAPLKMEWKDNKGEIFSKTIQIKA